MGTSTLVTPLFQASDKVFLKCEFLHPGRSHKARVARALVDDAEAQGHIKPGGERVLLERTGGNLGIALAIEARLRNYDLTLVTDPGYSRIKKEMARRLGATVIDRGIEYPECTNNGAVVDILLNRQDIDFFYLNQFQNPANPRAHEEGTGAEILAQLLGRGYGRDTTVIFVAGLGTGACMRGVSRALRTWFKNVLTFAVQPAICDILNQHYPEHSFQGIAVGEAPPFVDVHEMDAILSVTEAAAADAGRVLAERYRFLVGPSSAANFAALDQAQRHPLSSGRDCIYVTILYDRGEDYE